MKRNVKLLIDFFNANFYKVLLIIIYIRIQKRALFIKTMLFLIYNLK